MLIVKDGRYHFIDPDILFHIINLNEIMLEKQFLKGNSATKLKATKMPNIYYE